MRVGLLGTGLWALMLLPLPASAEEAPTAPDPAVADTAPLDLSIRARALGLVPEPYAGGTVDLEPMKAPTGAGVTRLPRPASGREPGGYIGVLVCDPDGFERLHLVRIDDVGSLPEGNLRGTPGPRHLFLPGRP